MGIFYTLFAYAISLVIAVGYVVIDIRIELLQKLIHQCNGCASVNIVVAIYQYAFLSPHSIVKPVNGNVHILHQEGVGKVGKLWFEKPFGCTLCCNAPLNKQACKYGVYVELFAQFLCLLLFFWCGWVILPFEMHCNLFLFCHQSY